MLLPLLLAASGIVGQYTDAEPEQWPRVFVMENGETIVGFVDKENWEDEAMIVVQRDEPWFSGRKTQSVLVSNIEDHYRELGSDWRARHEAAWSSYAFENMGSDKAPYYVKSGEVELAKRARAMAASEALPSGSPEAESTPEGAVQAPGAVAVPEPGFLAQWGVHIAVVLAGTGLAAAVKFLLLA